MSLFRKPMHSTEASDGVTVTDASPCQKALQVRVKPETLAPIRASVASEFQRQATLPGFRKGKAPTELVERHHGAAIDEETVQRTVKQTLEQATQAHHLKPVGPFEVSQIARTEHGGLTVDALVEVEPDFPLAAYQGIPIAATTVEVSPDELEKALTSLRESMAQLVPAGEGEPKERRVPALDDELAKDAGFDTLKQLTEHVRAKVLERKRAAARDAQETALFDALLARHTFDVPPRLVEHQTHRVTRDFKVRLLLSGVAEDQVEVAAGKFTEQLRTSAARHVKLGFILDRIAEAESVTVTQDELVARLWDLAKRWKKDPVEVRKHLDAEQLWPSVVSTIRQEKTVALVLAAAAVMDGAPMTKP